MKSKSAEPKPEVSQPQQQKFNNIFNLYNKQVELNKQHEIRIAELEKRLKDSVKMCEKFDAQTKRLSIGGGGGSQMPLPSNSQQFETLQKKFNLQVEGNRRMQQTLLRKIEECKQNGDTNLSLKRQLKRLKRAGISPGKQNDDAEGDKSCLCREQFEQKLAEVRDEFTKKEIELILVGIRQ